MFSLRFPRFMGVTGYKWSKMALSCALYLHDRLFLRQKSDIDPPKDDPHRPHVLLLRTDRLGDFLLWMPAARALCHDLEQQGYAVTLLCNQDAVPFACGLPPSLTIWPVDVQKLWLSLAYRRRILQKLQQSSYQWVINPVYSRYFANGDGLVRATGAPRRSGWDNMGPGCTKIGHFLYNKSYTDLIPPMPAPCHEYQINEAFLTALGIPLIPTSQPFFPASRQPQELSSFLSASVAERLSNHPQGYILLAPGSSSPLRRWPLAKFAALADQLFASTGALIVVCGQSSDQKLAETIKNNCKMAPVISLCGMMSVLELATVLQQARGLCSNDSMAAHLAAVVGCPLVCPLGSADIGRFMPYTVGQLFSPPVLPRTVCLSMPCQGCQWNCIHPIPPRNAAPCLEQIPLVAIYDAMMDVLRAPSKQKYSFSSVPKSVQEDEI